MNLLKRFKRVPYFFHFLYEKITSSIAFIPSLMAIASFLLTGLLIYLEQNGLTGWMEERLPSFVFIKSWDVAQAILSTLIGALISLMVFSFSMVMVLLNNAASNYSPRILPSLISNKFHQLVLGTYLGTITFCILLVINLKPSQPEIPLMGFSILIGIGLGLTCLMLFVFFIHSISESVQVGKILDSLHAETLDNLKNGVVSQVSNNPLPSGHEDWFTYPCDRSGYLKSINVKKIGAICEVQNIKLKILIPESKFLLEGVELFACDRELDEELRNKLLEYFVLSINELAEEDHIVGFKQITEIAVKAMSPGINDPGTALTAIDYLTILFMEKMKLSEEGGVVIKDVNDEELPTRLWLNIVSFEALLSSVLVPLRQYSKHDLIVMLRMLKMLYFLVTRAHCQPNQLKIILKEVEILKRDAKENITNPGDYNKVLASIRGFPKGIKEPLKYSV